MSESFKWDGTKRTQDAWNAAELNPCQSESEISTTLTLPRSIRIWGRNFQNKRKVDVTDCWNCFLSICLPRTLPARPKPKSLANAIYGRVEWPLWFWLDCIPWYYIRGGVQLRPESAEKWSWVQLHSSTSWCASSSCRTPVSGWLRPNCGDSVFKQRKQQVSTNVCRIITSGLRVIFPFACPLFHWLGWIKRREAVNKHELECLRSHWSNCDHLCAVVVRQCCLEPALHLLHWKCPRPFHQRQKIRILGRSVSR